MAKKEQHLQPKEVFIGAALGVVLFIAAFVGLEVMLPAQGTPGFDEDGDPKNYGYVYSGAKSASPAFNTAADADDSVLLFGTSELSTPASLVPEVPTVVFGFGNYGVDLTYVGEAYDQSLWQSMAAGAYAPYTDQKKVIIIVSPTWFEDGGLDNETFGLRFSYSLLRGFFANPDVPDDQKDYVAKRLKEQGIDEATVSAARRVSPIDWLNDAVLGAMDDLKLRSELAEVRELGISLADVDFEADAETVPFEDLRAEGEEEGNARSTNNDWGMDDDFYAKNIDGRLDALKDSQADETYSDTPEYEDFDHLLQICKDVGLEPLVVVSPLHGDFFDHVGVSEETRTQCYDRIVRLCAKNDVAVADFSDREYDKYFLHDLVHFGWIGWVDVEEAIYDFVTENE